MCLEGFKGVWEVTEKCLAGILKGMKGILRISGKCLESVWKASGRYQAGTGLSKID